MPRAPSSSQELLDLIRRSGVVPPDQLAGLSDLSIPAEPHKAAKLLVDQGVVTKFQAAQLLAGRHKGFRIGAYTVLDLLGRGGMGAVYLAEHTALHRKVAVKVLVPGKEDDQKLALERFQREARAAAALDHPNIVRIFDVSCHNAVPYLVMEYVEGDTLQQLIDRDGSIPYQTAAEYIAQAAAGLQHAHEKGFVHRDIKPGNLIRDKSGTIKILDMGLARSESQLDKLTAQLDNGAVLGTADFIAPEQAINNPSVDIRADIYSLGATFFSLVIGKPPFQGNTTQKLLQHQLRDAPTLVSVDATLPKGLSLVVEKMLEKKPADRFQTPAEVIAALAPWLGQSAKIIAGLTHTTLGQSSELQFSLSSISHGSSRRLPTVAVAGDTAEVGVLVDPCEAAQETGALATSQTTRDATRPKPVAPAAVRSRKGLIIGFACVLLAASLLLGWLVLGREKKAEAAASDQQPGRAAPPTETRAEPVASPSGTNPSGTPVSHVHPVPEEAGEKVIFKYDAAGQRPFLIRSTITVDPGNPGNKTYTVLSKSGIGEPPARWQARCWNKDTEMEFFAEPLEDRAAIGFRNVQGPASAMLYAPSFECPTGVCRLKLEYQANTRARGFLVKFKPADQRRAWEVAMPAPTGDVWRVEDLIVNLKGATGGSFEFHDLDGNPSARIHIRSMVVTELKALTIEGEKVVYDLDLSEVRDFRTTRQGFDPVPGSSSPPAIDGIHFGGYKKETLSVWSRETHDDVRVLGITNVNEVVSAQLAVSLEAGNGGGAHIAPGDQLRLRVVYRTSGSARGTAFFQSFGDWKQMASVPMPTSNDGWKTVEVVGTRGEKPIRCVIDAREPGMANTIFIRSITVTEVSNKTHTGLVEGKSVYSVDVAAIPRFRVQKEQFISLNGTSEALPPGITCQCRKEKGIAEFRCDTIEDAPALMVTNLNDEMSGQLAFALDGKLGGASGQPGRSYRVKISYLARNEAAGQAILQSGSTIHATASLRNSDEKWRTAILDLASPAVGTDLRLVVENTTVGEGNTLCIRSVEVVEVTPVSPTAKTAR
jgi:serine/threonine protein kinase